MKNKDIHEAFEKSGVRKWIVASRIGIADTTFSRRLRRELPQNEKDKIFKAIKEIEKEMKKEV